MKISLLLLYTAFAFMVAGCGEGQRSTAPPPVAASPEPGSKQGEAPAVTASSAAAAAPECKDLEKADPKSCHPQDAVGDPNAK